MQSKNTTNLNIPVLSSKYSNSSENCVSIHEMQSHVTFRLNQMKHMAPTSCMVKIADERRGISFDEFGFEIKIKFWDNYLA